MRRWSDIQCVGITLVFLDMLRNTIECPYVSLSHILPEIVAFCSFVPELGHSWQLVPVVCSFSLVLCGLGLHPLVFLMIDFVFEARGWRNTTMVFVCTYGPGLKITCWFSLGHVCAS